MDTPTIAKIAVTPSPDSSKGDRATLRRHKAIVIIRMMNEA
jgi:hypothetical protein